MPDLALKPSIAPDLWAGLRVAEVTTAIVDIPTRRAHKLSSLSTSQQNYVLVRVRTADGAEGVGEAATSGRPALERRERGGDQGQYRRLSRAFHIGASGRICSSGWAPAWTRPAKRNTAAKSAIESALFDVVGKTLGVSATTLLGGAVRDRIRVLWTLASGDPEQEVAEAEEKLALGLHNIFKVKLGAQTPRADMARMTRIATALEGRAELIVDANQAWSETVARRCLDQMDEMGVTLVEQPLPAPDLAGMARLRAACAIPLMADEAIFSPEDAFAVGRAGAADVVSLKLVKHGRAARNPQGRGGLRSRWPRTLWRLFAGKLRRGGGASTGLRHAAPAGLALRAFRAADPLR